MLQVSVITLVVTVRLCVVLQLRLCEFESRPRVQDLHYQHFSASYPEGIQVEARPAASDSQVEVSALKRQVNKVFDRYPIIIFNLR